MWLQFGNRPKFGALGVFLRNPCTRAESTLWLSLEKFEVGKLHSEKLSSDGMRSRCEKLRRSVRNDSPRVAELAPTLVLTLSTIYSCSPGTRVLGRGRGHKDTRNRRMRFTAKAVAAPVEVCTVDVRVEVVWR